MKSLSAQALLEQLKQKVADGHYNDSVHKIKLMTAIEIIEKALND